MTDTQLAAARWAMTTAEWTALDLIRISELGRSEHVYLSAVRATGLYGWACAQYEAALSAAVAAALAPVTP